MQRVTRGISVNYANYLVFIAFLLASFIPLFPIIFADTSTTTVAVTNIAPYIIRGDMNIFVSTGDTSVTLSDNSTVQVVCNATVNDVNGFNDVSGLNGTVWDASTARGGIDTDDNNDQYTNTSCSLITGSGTSRGGECQFTVWYYANNATWSCNLSAYDSGNLINSTYANATVNALIALVVPGTIDFGTVEPGATSAVQRINVTNSGNKLIDLKIHGFGNNLPDSANAMNCTTGSVKNITLAQLRYNVTPVAYDTSPSPCFGVSFLGNSSRLTNSSNNITWTGFDQAARTDDTIEKKNVTCWVLQVPTTGVGGTCRGTVDFTAV